MRLGYRAREAALSSRWLGMIAGQEIDSNTTEHRVLQSHPTFQLKVWPCAWYRSKFIQLCGVVS
jgi:hypothetical protein